VLLLTAYSFQLSASAATLDREYVEKLFLEEKYEKVIVEAKKLIGENVSRRDELYYLKGKGLNHFKPYIYSDDPLTKTTIIVYKIDWEG